MTQIASNTFSEGLMTDLNPLSTPNTVLTDCLNGTIITYNGNEFTLQNDLGNVKMNNISFPVGFIPVGMKEYGGIIYVALYSPSTEQCQIGSFPSPQTLSYGVQEFATMVSFSHEEMIDSTTHNAKTILKPLFNMVDKLNPGDRYKIQKTVSGADAGLFDEQINGSVNPNRIFKTKFFYQTEDNKIIQIQNSDITINGDIESTYFKGTSGAVFAVSYEIENLEYFNVNIDAISGNSIIIQAKGSHDYLNLFKGFKLETTQGESKQTFNFSLGNGAYNQIIDLQLNSIDTTKNLDILLTPFSDYSFFNNMSVKRSFTPYKLAEISSSLNYTYKYYIDNDNLKVDFNFKYDSKNLDLFVELYDPVSDCSTIKKVDDPTQYGINTVLFDVVDEPVIDTNDDTTRKGILYTELDQKKVSDYNLEKYHAIIPLPKSGTDYIYTRKYSKVRKNHFYIIRICSVEKYSSNNYVYNYFMKSLYTIDLFNQYYNTIDDFEKINLQLSDVVSFGYSIESDQIIDKPNTYGYDSDSLKLITDDQTFKVSQSQLQGSYFHYNNYNQNRQLKIKLTYNSPNMFGVFNEALLNTTDKATITSALGSYIKTSFSEDFSPVSKVGSDQNSTNQEKGLTSNVILNTGDYEGVEKIDAFNYKFIFDYNTYRNTSANKSELSQQIDYYQKFPLLNVLGIKSTLNPSSLNVVKTPPGGYCPDESVSFLKYGNSWYLSNTNGYDVQNHYGYYKKWSGDFDDSLGALISQLRTEFSKNNLSSIVVNVNSQYCWMLGDFSEGTTDAGQYSVMDSSPVNTWKKCVLVIMQDTPENTNFIRIHNIDDIKEFFNNVYVCSINSGQYYTYCPDMGTFNNINQGTTTYKQSISLSASLNNIGSSLFKFYSYKDQLLKDFNASNIKDLLSHVRITNNGWIGVDKISSQAGENLNIYPILQKEEIYAINIPIPDYSITKSSNPGKDGSTFNIQNIFNKGQSLLSNEINITPPTTHGKLFATKTLKLQKLLDCLTVTDLDGNDIGSTNITNSNFRIKYKARNTGYGDDGHRGKWRNQDDNVKRDAPNMNDDYLY